MNADALWVAQTIVGILVVVVGAYVQLLRGEIHQNREDIKLLEKKTSDLESTAAAVMAKLDAIDENIRLLREDHARIYHGVIKGNP